MLNVKKPLILAGLITAWPVLCLGASEKSLDVPSGSDGLVEKMAYAVIFIIVLGGAAIYLTKKNHSEITASFGAGYKDSRDYPPRPA